MARGSSLGNKLMVATTKSTGAVSRVAHRAGRSKVLPYFAYEVDQLSWKSFTVFMYDVFHLSWKSFMYETFQLS